MMNLLKLQKNLGYYFNNTNLLYLALTHCSAAINHNEKLEFLGDSTLNYIISLLLYNKYPNKNEGDLSKMRASLVKGKTLAIIAKNLKINKFLLLGKGELKTAGYNKPSILANTLEAIIGAIFLDNHNLNKVESIILQWFNNYLDTIEIVNNKDYKSKLQELLQKKKLLLPIYMLKKKIGVIHAQTFIIECKVSIINKIILGKGNNKKQAEQNAAKKVLYLINKK